MSDSHVSEPAAPEADMMSALFAQMILQQSNLAMMLMGKTPHPESGQKMRDIEGAKLFIDQLEMLEAKTKGNLSKEESDLLKQSLMALRMAFVECVNSAPMGESRAEASAQATGTSPRPEAAQGAAKPETSGGEEESRKKFTKKY
jgi:hypothetical protein